MSGERETTVNGELEEKRILAHYANQEGIPFDGLYDSVEIDPFETFYDEYCDDAVSQFHFSIITGLYDEMPSSDLFVESSEFVDRLYGRKRDLLMFPEALNDVEKADILRGINPESSGKLAAWMHGNMIGVAQVELKSGHISDVSVGRLVFWSKMDKIISTANAAIRYGKEKGHDLRAIHISTN